MKIGEQWAKLAAGTSITITEKSPVFNDGNAFSIPFQLNAEMNRHLLGNATEVEGISFYEAIDRKPATLYVQGIPLFYGVIRLDSEEAAMEDGYIDVNLESGNLSLEDRISNMSCRDVPVMDKVYIGSALDESHIFPELVALNDKDKIKEWFDTYPYIPVQYGEAFQRKEVIEYNEGASNPTDLPRGGYSNHGDFSVGHSTVNISNAYPLSKFCNIKLCMNMPEKDEDMDYTPPTGKSDFSEEFSSCQVGQYFVLDENRKHSAPCFYVLYFLDCLFNRLGMSVKHDIAYMEDMCRLAFVNTKYGYDKELAGTYICSHLALQTPTDNKGNPYGMETMEEMFVGEGKITTSQTVPPFDDPSLNGVEMPIYNCIANSECFPDVSVDNLLDAVKSGFGVRFVMNYNRTEVRTVFVKDILRSKECEKLNCSVYDVTKVDYNRKGFRLSYSEGDDDTSFNYTDYSRVVLTDSYSEVLAEINYNNKNLYIDKRNGNAYRIKVNEEAKTISELDPKLFEVAQFGKVEYGDCSDEDLIESVEIGFIPVIMNDTGLNEQSQMITGPENEQGYIDLNSPRQDGKPDNRSYTDDNALKQQFALYLDVEMGYPSWSKFIDNTIRCNVNNYEEDNGEKFSIRGRHYKYWALQRYEQTESTIEERYAQNSVFSLRYENKNPIEDYDCGFMLGIMRGPGNSSGVEDYEENYDEEGNFKYAIVSSSAAFHSDICDNYNRLFDYNGTEQGGVDVSGRFSLKLRAEKPNPEGGFFPITDVNMQKRGLFDKFYAEYAYFVTHRKLLKMKLRIEMADLLQIDWSKRYMVGNLKGFINKFEYTVTDEGIGVVSMELYTL